MCLPTVLRRELILLQGSGCEGYVGEGEPWLRNWALFVRAAVVELLLLIVKTPPEYFYQSIICREVYFWHAQLQAPQVNR